MPYLKTSSYRKPKWLLNPHIETILPSTIRKVKDVVSHERVRIETLDDDFLDIDEYETEGKKALIVSHGLEGDSKRAYVMGMVKRFSDFGWDVYAWNFRGCSGEINRASRMYHSGATDDLHTVVQYVSEKGYDQISMVGFSLGGNLTLKYLGEYDLEGVVKSAVVFSVPLDLAASSKIIDLPENTFYSTRFLKSLTKKVIDKKEQKPDLFKGLDELKFSSLYQFDDLITAPLHGFRNADHYYRSNGSRYFIQQIKIPTLVVNAANDPFLARECLDPSYFETSEHVYFEMPKFGGHVGFSSSNASGVYWSEERALRFITCKN